MGDKTAEKSIDAKIIRKTQDTLGKIIKKPPLTDKLLQKPPFRFLHDVITSVVKQTGFMKGLFTDSEMNSENVKEKDSKIAFLQKVLDMVSLVLAKPIAAKPAKIIAGHDADRTNELLQALAEAINKKVDNDDYVRRVLKTEDSKPPPAARKESKESSRSKDKEEPSKRQRDKSVDADDKEKSSGDRHRSRDREREASKDKDAVSRSSDKRDKDREERHRSRSDAQPSDSDKSKGDHSRGDRKDKKDDSADEQKLQRPTSAKGSRRHQSRDESSKEESKKDETRKEDSKREDSKKEDSKKSSQINNDDDYRQSKNKSIRPSSSRPAPPKPKKNDISSEEPLIMGGRKVPNVIVDKNDNSDDEDNEDNDNENDFLNAQTQPDSSVSRPEMNGSEETDDSHGGLVKKILEAKKEAEHQPGKKTEIDRSQVMSDATRRKERDIVQRDIDKLRSSVQTLTRSVNPLGKILDFVQEDFDAMQKELEVWRRENRENIVALQREQSVTESSIEPLNAQLSELDAAIRDQLDLIAAVKSTILHNDLKITKMLGSVSKS